MGQSPSLYIVVEVEDSDAFFEKYTFDEYEEEQEEITIGGIDFLLYKNEIDGDGLYYCAQEKNSWLLLKYVTGGWGASCTLDYIIKVSEDIEEAIKESLGSYNTSANVVLGFD